MLKKIFKGLFKLLLGAILLLVLLYAGFHTREYLSGGKFVRYLKANSETVALEDSFSFAVADSDIKKNKLILVGEIHGFAEPQKFDVRFFKYLHEHHQVNHYFAELDYVQALFLNLYLQNGDEALLKDVLKNWVVAQGRNNKDYFNKYREFYNYYQQVPTDDKFEFIGIDRMQDIRLTSTFLNRLLPIADQQKETTNKDSILQQIDLLNAVYQHSPDTLFILSHIKDNLNRLANKENREQVMFHNFHTLYQNKHLENSKSYGYFGLFHIFQYRVNGKHPLAAQIRQSDLGLEEQILSMNFLLNDSQMVMPSGQLPPFMRDEGRYTKMPVSADNLLFMYIYGIKDFKRMTPKNHKSLIKLNSANSPYADSKRMNQTIQLLPVTDLFEMNEKGKAYVQYTIFVRNSDWAEPFWFTKKK